MQKCCFDYKESRFCYVSNKGKSTILTAFLEILSMY